MGRPRARVSAAVLGTPDPRALAAFYEQLLGWTRVVDEPAPPGAPPEDGWAMLRPPPGGTGLSFQYDPDYGAPTWPPVPGNQQMQVHLDIAVEDLDQGVACSRSGSRARWSSTPGACPRHARPRRESVLPIPRRGLIPRPRGQANAEVLFGAPCAGLRLSFWCSLRQGSVSAIPRVVHEAW